jgi:hypothetical protein
MKSKVVDVGRKNDRIITVKLVFEEVLYVTSVYALQIECEVRKKIDEAMQGIPENEDAVIDDDINGHVDSEIVDYERMHVSMN